MSTAFHAAAKAYAVAALSSQTETTSANQEACRTVAIGYLSKMSQKAINETARTVGGYTDAQWKVAKVALSRAWRPLGGEFGFGEVLATMWASGDFRKSLAEMYKASAPPKAAADLEANALKAMLLLSPAGRERVTEQLENALADLETHREAQAAKFAELLSA